MAARYDGFCIRDYTSKMRSIDVFKCWPFTTTTSRDVTREEVQSWLPPMTRCPRSNHNDAQNPENQPSAREVSRTDDDVDDDDDDDNCSQDSAKSEKSAPPSTADTAADDEKLEMVCPVCREFNAATLTAVNAHIDGCLSQSMREERRHMRMMNLKPSSKSKAPKKRSIAEIFKVEEEEQEKEQEQEQQKEQPQIESVLKFWPFHEEDGTDDDVSSTVTKFQWLSRRLEALRSNRGGSESAKSDKGDSAEEEKLEMVCPVCRDFNAATVTAVNAHIDGCLAQAVRDERRQMRRTCSKPKTKLPKKRSIAEILTVAPPIEASKSKAIEVEEDEDKSDYCGGDSSAVADADADAAVVSVIKSKKSTNKNRKTKKTKKAKKKKKKSKVEKLGDSVVSLNNENKTIVNKKKKRKKKRKNVFNNELTGKKVAETGGKLI